MTVAFSHPGQAGAAREPAAASQGLPDARGSSDTILIGRIARGDELAMRTLFARYRVPVYRFVLRIVRDPALAEDILSETFLAAWRQAPRFEARASVATWLLSIARYRAISALRRPREGALDGNMAERIADPGDDPEAALEKKSRDATLRERIAALSPEHAEVIDLVYYHGKSVAEVAQIAGIPEATVKTRMFYARKRLTQLVEAA